MFTPISVKYHQEQLQKFCRVCGGRLNKAKGRAQAVYSCSEYSLSLEKFAGISIQVAEEDSTFPMKFCNLCYVKLESVKKAIDDGFPVHQITPMEWLPHQDDCKVREI